MRKETIITNCDICTSEECIGRPIEDITFSYAVLRDHKITRLIDMCAECFIDYKKLKKGFIEEFYKDYNVPKRCKRCDLDMSTSDKDKYYESLNAESLCNECDLAYIYNWGTKLTTFSNPIVKKIRRKVKKNCSRCKENSDPLVEWYIVLNRGSLNYKLCRSCYDGVVKLTTKYYFAHDHKPRDEAIKECNELSVKFLENKEILDDF